jgi:DNA-directed RNA polymerase subunit M
MQFCPKCGTTLTPQKKEKKVVLSCPKCGYETRKGQKNLSMMQQDSEKIVVIGKEAQRIRTLPKTRAECPKCGHNEAFYWLVQTRGADESSTQFFRCTKCQTTWRESA